MNDKKNIDRLFQEQLKDFEVNPPEFVWENIREKLEEKKKRRAVPIWFRYSGVAAGLVAGAFFGWQYLSDSSNTDKPQTDDAVVLQHVGGEPATAIDPTRIPNQEEVNSNSQENTLSGNPSTLVSNDEAGADDAAGLKNSATGIRSKEAKSNGKKGVKNGLPTVSSHQGLVQGGNSGKTGSKLKYNSGIGQQDENKQVAYDNSAQTSAKNTTVTNLKDKHNAQGKINTPQGSFTNGAVANVSAQNNSARVEATADKGVSGAESQLATNSRYAGSNDKNGGTQNNFGQENEQNALRVNSALLVIDKDIALRSMLPGEQKILAQAYDTVKPVSENELEKLLREKESGKKDSQVAESNGPKWNVKPQVAPVFYNSFSSGSPIDQQFASNSKNYDKDLSVGVGLNYAVNDRFTIRSGVNTVNLNYATQDIQFYASLEGSTNNVTAKSNATARNATIVVTNRSEGFSTNAMTDSYSGSMVQTTGYVEVPLEMSYALLRNKFGIEVIGGVSTLFLNENKVSVVSTQGLSTTVGEADNLNNVHFSTNIGLGFKYRIFKTLEANFEPTFKYQVNTYSHDAGNFKPYFIGLYSGVSFSF